MTKLACVSVDLDEIQNYYSIHGLPLLGDEAHLDAVYKIAMDRLFDMAERAKIPLTFFAIGKDLAQSFAAAKIKEAVKLEHEVANHSLNHRYDLSTLSPEKIRDEVLGGARAIELATGKKPLGFRAPGYTMSDELLEQISNSGALYDSSVFPCPVYYAAKWSIIQGLQLRGRKSKSIVGSPRMLTAKTQPYFAGYPYYRSTNKQTSRMLELPIQVTPIARLPFIGTSLVMAGKMGARYLTRMCIGSPLINLELHGIDVLSVDDGLEKLKAHQPDVGIAADKKRDIFFDVFGILKNAGYTFLRMHEAAEMVIQRHAS